MWKDTANIWQSWDLNHNVLGPTYDPSSSSLAFGSQSLLVVRPLDSRGPVVFRLDVHQLSKIRNIMFSANPNVHMMQNWTVFILTSTALHFHNCWIAFLSEFDW